MKPYDKVQLKVYLLPNTRKKLDELTGYWELTNSAMIEDLIVKARQEMHRAWQIPNWREQ